METTHLVVARNLTTNVVRKHRVALIEGYTTEADIPAIIETNWGKSEIIKIVPVEELVH
ncbi:hypothetical protein SEA_KEALII_58 [Arthrobacter phage KeAlii]|uniref:Uncharacterized protein n=1 Tax=Arthrobacter phage KeAlii TaxID=2885973 RepID=A0AA94WXZ9_9CAUD|nr:hypothetical protein PQE15_gp58 [Arthrobacter phage KeAlii]UDL14664.1 hypothetical protein SEA_KEALII_58 [Arthrobacter phage KeAlii]